MAVAETISKSQEQLVLEIPSLEPLVNVLGANLASLQEREAPILGPIGQEIDQPVACAQDTEKQETQETEEDDTAMGHDGWGANRLLVDETRDDKNAMVSLHHEKLRTLFFPMGKDDLLFLKPLEATRPPPEPPPKLLELTKLNGDVTLEDDKDLSFNMLRCCSVGASVAFEWIYEAICRGNQEHQLLLLEIILTESSLVLLDGMCMFNTFVVASVYNEVWLKKVIEKGHNPLRSPLRGEKNVLVFYPGGDFDKSKGIAIRLAALNASIRSHNCACLMKCLKKAVIYVVFGCFTVWTGCECGNQNIGSSFVPSPVATGFAFDSDFSQIGNFKIYPILKVLGLTSTWVVDMVFGKMLEQLSQCLVLGFTSALLLGSSLKSLWPAVFELDWSTISSYLMLSALWIYSCWLCPDGNGACIVVYDASFDQYGLCLWDVAHDWKLFCCLCHGVGAPIGPFHAAINQSDDWKCGLYES